MPFVASRAWLGQAAALVPARDAVEVLAPALPIARIARYALAPHKLRAPADDVSRGQRESTIQSPATIVASVSSAVA